MTTEDPMQQSGITKSQAINWLILTAAVFFIIAAVRLPFKYQDANWATRLGVLVIVAAVEFRLTQAANTQYAKVF